MKQDLVRQTTSLKKEVQDILNEQIRLESFASTTYLAMASWCDRNGYENSAKFFYADAEEERSHMLKIFKFINDVGGSAYAAEITDIKQEYASLKEVFENTLDHEITVTKAINKIVEICRKEKDYITENFLQWFINEQVEEEQVARRCVELFDLIGTEGQGLYLIDQEIAKVSVTTAPPVG